MDFTPYQKARRVIWYCQAQSQVSVQRQVVKISLNGTRNSSMLAVSIERKEPIPSGRGSPNLPWPPYSPDLTPMDFFLCDYIKSRLHNYN
jgi:hypothetical protein